MCFEWDCPRAPLKSELWLSSDSGSLGPIPLGFVINEHMLQFGPVRLRRLLRGLWGRSCLFFLSVLPEGRSFLSLDSVLWIGGLNCYSQAASGRGVSRPRDHDHTQRKPQLNDLETPGPSLSWSQFYYQYLHESIYYQFFSIQFVTCLLFPATKARQRMQPSRYLRKSHTTIPIGGSLPRALTLSLWNFLCQKGLNSLFKISEVT